MLVPVMLAAFCGLRRGEVVALRWRSVDLERAQMSIFESSEQTTKGVRSRETKNGRAGTVALPSLVVEELKRHRLRTAEELLKLGAKVEPDTPVVSREDGSPLQPNSLTHEFVRILAKTRNVQKIRYHDLRHTHATHLLANGVHPKVAQERLGHSTVGIALDLYSHVMPGMQEDAASTVDAAIWAAIQKV